MSMEEQEDNIRKLVENPDSVDVHNNAELEDMDKILQTAGNWDVAEGRSQAAIWQALEKKIEDKDSSVIKKRILGLRIAIAASVLLMGSLAYYFIQSAEVIVGTAVAQTKVIELPDGTSVTLNSSSSIAYDAEQFKERRFLKLDGEAYFDVAPGNEFTIRSGEITTRVLGTSFNLFAREGNFKLKCISGKVSVRDRERSVVLTKGEAIAAKNNELDNEKGRFDSTKAISWTEGKFYYENAEFNIVVKELEIQFGIEVEGPDFDQRFYSGYFDNENLDTALKQVFVPMGYSYKIVDKTIFIQ